MTFGKKSPYGSTPLPTGFTPGSVNLLGPDPGGTGRTVWGGYTPQQIRDSANRLPYQDLIDQNLGTINDLIGEVNTSTAPQRDLNTARNLSRQGSYTRGIDGPLAVALEGDSQGRVIDAFQRQRLGNLAMLLGLSNQISSGQQSIQIQQRWQEYLRKLQEAQASADNQTAWMTGLGTLLGGGAGFFLGGPAGIIPGAQIGGGAGGALSGVF
jgi:hypothetical protein